MKLDIVDIKGEKSGDTHSLDATVFGSEPNNTLIYEDVRRFQTNKRNGTASTKERGQVRGGGRKAYRQKGTGMARRGSIRSPLLKGGGTTHGPRPKDYKHGLPKKMKRLARISAFSLRQSKNQIGIIEDFDFDEPKTKKLVEILQALDIYGKKVLLLTSGHLKNVYLSGRNIPRLSVLEANKVTTYQIMNADYILVQKSAIETIETILGPDKEEIEE